LNIALDNPEEPELFQEPLVLCARFQYHDGEGDKCKGEWDPWDLWFYKAANALNRVYGKTELLLAPPFCAESRWSEQSIQAMREIHFIAVPLTNLVDSKALKEKVLRSIMSSGQLAESDANSQGIVKR
jgi:hypothetical protein